MTETTDAAGGVDLTDNSVVDALAFGWRLFSLALAAVLALAWTGFWVNVAYINATNGDLLGGLLTIGLLLGTLGIVVATARQ